MCGYFKTGLCQEKLIVVFETRSDNSLEMWYILLMNIAFKAVLRCHPLDKKYYLEWIFVAKFEQGCCVAGLYCRDIAMTSKRIRMVELLRNRRKENTYTALTSRPFFREVTNRLFSHFKI